MKLYKATLVKTLVVVIEAESEDDAQGIIEDQGESIIDEDDFTRFEAGNPIEVLPGDNLPHAWNGGCLPYRCRSRSDEPEKTISELREMSK